MNKLLLCYRYRIKKQNKDNYSNLNLKLKKNFIIII